MSTYEHRRWEELNERWSKERRKIVPVKAREALGSAGTKTTQVLSKTGGKLVEVTPQRLKNATSVVGDAALEPTIKAVAGVLEWTTDMVTELTDPAKVLEYHRSHGRDVQTLADLRTLDLKELDEFTRRMSLKWRGVGIAQGGAFGTLAFVPVVGTGASIILDTVVSQVLTTAIATRVAYAYGFDPNDADQKKLIERMVLGAYTKQVVKAGAVNETAKAYAAGVGRQRWSQKLRDDHRILDLTEKLMSQFNGTKGTPVGKVVAKMPAIGVVTSAGLNARMLGNVAEQARQFAATTHLVEKYGLPMPTKLGHADIVEVETLNGARDLPELPSPEDSSRNSGSGHDRGDAS
jgi:hypothetical protein